MSGIDRDDELAAREADRAAAEAGAIGGRVSSEPDPVDGEGDEATRPLAEAGQGEAEGFEQAEQELIEHASHGDLHSTWQATEDAPLDSDDARAAGSAEA